MSLIHIVEPGDCMPSIARQYGFVNWKVIWDHKDNDELRKQHPNPETLAPGDEVAIPDKEAREVTVSKGSTADTSLKPEKTLLRLAVYADPAKKGPKGKWELYLEGIEFPEKGDLASDGVISVEMPSTVENAELRLFLTGADEPDETYELAFGGLDPASTVAGAQERLRRLGYECGDIDGELGVRTHSALLTFQEQNGLDPSGELDQPTVNMLVDLFEGGGAYPEADPQPYEGNIASEDGEGADGEGTEEQAAVSLTLSWPSEVIEQLPEDLALVLEGTDAGTLTVPASDASSDGGNLVFEFEWEAPECSTTLKAQGGGEELVLWSGQVVDSDTPPQWSAHLESWLPEHPKIELASLDAGPGEDFVVAAKEKAAAEDGTAVASADDGAAGDGKKGIDIDLGIGKIHLGIG